MKLGNVALAAVILFGVLWLAGVLTGLIFAVPYGFIGLIPLAIVGGLLVTVIVQRLSNREDDYYDRNVDR